MARRPPQITIEDLRRDIGNEYSDDELLLLVLVSGKDLQAMRAAGPIQTEYSATGKPLISFIQELSKRKDTTYVSIQKGNFSLTLKRNDA